MRLISIFLTSIIFCTSCSINKEKSLINKLYLLPDVKEVQVSESDALHFFDCYFDVKMTVNNGDSIFIGEIKSNLLFDKNTKLYYINKTNVFHETDKIYCLFIPVNLLSEAYGKQITDFYTFYKDYIEISEFLNDLNSKEKFRSCEGFNFSIGRYNNEKIKLNL